MRARLLIKLEEKVLSVLANAEKISQDFLAVNHCTANLKLVITHSLFQSGLLISDL